MSDRRFHRGTDRVAPGSAAPDWRQVTAPVADLRERPGGPRDRQLLTGTRVAVIDDRGDVVFGHDADDGYCGWIAAATLGPVTPIDHVISVPGSHAYAVPNIKTPDALPLSMGARLGVLGYQGRFAQTALGYVPAPHLSALGDLSGDSVSVARMLIGTPYLWGGNSRWGIDCSGLVQMARRMAGLACPPDSDLQRAMPGKQVDAGHLQAGDLVFWPGHVALVTSDATIIHANAHHMSVVEEPLHDAVARIGALTCCLRPTSSTGPSLPYGAQAPRQG